MEQTQPYSNMKARRVVLVLGFVMTLVGFLIAAYAVASLFVPSINVFRNVMPINAICSMYVVSISFSFIGIVFAVAGANTQKAIARLSFFFGTIAFIGSAGFLVVLLPFNALTLGAM